MTLLGRSDDADAKARLLPGIASGETIATVTCTEAAGSWEASGVTVTAEPLDNRWKFNGVASFVMSANIANVLLVIAHTPTGIGCFEVAPDNARIEPLRSCDPTLRMSRIFFEDTEATPIAGVDGSALEYPVDLGRIALAGEQAGASRRIFDLTVDYLKTRVQFGRPIGGFQALKHMAADLLIEVESATSAATSRRSTKQLRPRKDGSAVKPILRLLNSGEAA